MSRFLLLGLVLLVPDPICASTLVVPNGLNVTPGNSNAVQDPDVRSQWFFAASQFPSTPILIGAIAFRPDEIFGGPFSYTNPNLSFTLSTSKRPFNALSLIFADNVGADAVVVLTGSLTYGSASASGSPRPFDIVFTFDIPFYYDPSLALPLLIDIRSAGTLTGGTFWDFQKKTDSFRDISQHGIDSTVGNLITDDTYVTQFSFTVVPEPDSFSLEAAGCGVLAAASIARRRRKRAHSRPAARPGFWP